MVFDKELMAELLKQASVSPRKRQNFDLRNSPADTSQRMLNAMQPGTAVPIHRHENTAETVVCLQGRLEEVLYEETTSRLQGDTPAEEEVEPRKTFKEIARYLLSPDDGVMDMQIPAGVWHTVNVLEPSVIFEAKDGAYVPR